jgi:hypothetical protein
MRSRGPRTTKLYDRTKERLTQDEIERNDAELAGVVGNDDRVRQQPLMADRAPRRAFAGGLDGIGGDLEVGQPQAL